MKSVQKQRVKSWSIIIGTWLQQKLLSVVKVQDRYLTVALKNRRILYTHFSFYWSWFFCQPSLKSRLVVQFWLHINIWFFKKEIPVFLMFYSVRKYIFYPSCHLMSPLKDLHFVYSGETCHTVFSTYPDLCLWYLLISPSWFCIFPVVFKKEIILVHLKWSVYFQNINPTNMFSLNEFIAIEIKNP